MAKYEKQHYIQNKLLKNFAIKSKNGKYKIQVVDLNKKTLSEMNTESAFYKKNLYDVNKEDVKKLEKDLNSKIEEPFNIILDRLINEKYDTFTINRKELEVIKKYLLIQRYRSFRNSLSYTGNHSADKHVLSTYNIENNETEIDFWKREMQTILDCNFDELVSKKMVGVTKNASEAHSSFLMFFHTTSEFIINDLGYVTERYPVNINIDPKEYAKIAEKVGKNLFGAEGFGSYAEERAKNNLEYLDNFFVFPVSSNMAIILVSEVWKLIMLNKIKIKDLDLTPSPTLTKYFSFPINEYVNHKLIKNVDDLSKYKSPYDRYIYKIQELDDEDTEYINTLTLNEAYNFVGFKTLDTVKSSIYLYELKSSLGVKNTKNDYSFLVDIIDNHDESSLKNGGQK